MKCFQVSFWSVLSGIALLALVGGITVVGYKWNKSTPEARGEDGIQHPGPSNEVKVIHPRKGALERLSMQPCTVEMFESVKLYARVAGFLKSQYVDIGSDVEEGQTLAVIDIPELEKQKLRNEAGVKLARSKVNQMKARVVSARADFDAATASVDQAQSTANSAKSLETYRRLQKKRMIDLAVGGNIEDRIVDEAIKYHEAAEQAKFAAEAAIETTRAQVLACGARIVQARADVASAEAEVEVAQAELGKSEVLIDFATIKAPFNGVVTHRNYFPKDYIRAASEGGNHEPLFTIDRIDKIRVVVLLPERDVPFIDENDIATVELDAFPDVPSGQLTGKISVIGKTLDPQTRLMRIEVHLPNPTGKVYQNVYGHATIVLDKQLTVLSIPDSCLVKNSDAGKKNGPMSNLRWDFPTMQAQKTKSTVYVVRDGCVQPVEVRLGASDGLRVVVLGGLNADDEVVYQPGSNLHAGAEVTAKLWNDKEVSQR